jgi:transcriptional regulator with XRE-family HTH domain
MDAPTLRAWRTARRLSRREAAEVLGINERTLEDLEYGRSTKSPLWGPIAKIIGLLEPAAH